MKQKIKRLAAFLLTLALAAGLAAPAFAQSAEVVFKGQSEGFDLGQGSEYTATDLFGGLKNVMPGDTLTETIRLRSEAGDCDEVRLYLRVRAHDEADNPLTYSEAYENADGKDQTGEAGARDETVATMQEFLAQLTLRIYSGDTLIYESTPDQTGALASYVPLATLARGESCTLRVELEVPAELDNRFADRVGEVDWVFLAEGITHAAPGGGTLIQTGQWNWPVLVLGAAGLALVVCGIVLLRRRGGDHAQ